MVLFLKLKQGQGGMNQRISQNSCSEASSDMRKRNNHKFSVWFLVWVVVSNIFYFYPYLEKIPILTNIFQMGWNRQPVVIYPFFVLMVWILEVCFAYIHQGGEMWVFSVFKIYDPGSRFATTPPPPPHGMVPKPAFCSIPHENVVFAVFFAWWVAGVVRNPANSLDFCNQPSENVLFAMFRLRHRGVVPPRPLLFLRQIII